MPENPVVVFDSNVLIPLILKASIVSEDKHLLDLKEYQGIKIMNRAQFETELNRLGVAAG
ncbi:MAG: hypothetical protein ACC742_14465 [Thermoanaerobaculales bacterium]